MVIHAFPIAKLGALLIKQISKPIANFVKQQAKSHPVFRTYVCLPPAQFYNWCEKKSKMWLLKMGQPVNITVLNEAASIELGANLLGEAVIFLIAAGILVSEYNRSANKEAAKEAAKREEMESIQNSLRDLFIQSEQQATHIREITRKLGDLETQLIQKSWTPKDNPSKSPPPTDPKEVIPSSPPLTEHSNIEEAINDVNLIENYQYNPSRGMVFKALNEVEKEFLMKTDQTREPGIIIAALNLLYKDVYRTPLSF